MNATDATRGTNRTDAFLATNTTLGCLTSKYAVTTCGRATDGEAEADGLSEELTLIEIDADDEVEGERDGEVDELHE